jgi:hypothetical protein
MTEACSYCAAAFGVREQVEELKIPLLDPSIHS